MIEFYINGDYVEVQIENEQTIGDILQSFELQCEENRATVIGITVDGNQITAENFDKVSEEPLGKNRKFEFTIVTQIAIEESLDSLSVLFESLSEKMEQIPVDIQNGKTLEVSESIKKLADSIDNFCHVAALASLFPESFNLSQINGMDFKDFFADFSQILLDFEQALQNNDSVMIGDLSEYEICPRLTAISTFLKSM